MRHLVWYLRSVFCKHEWDYEEKFVKVINSGKQDYKVSATCKKCGWHRKYWKFI